MVCLFNNNLGLWLKSVSRYAGIRAGALDHFPHEFSGGQRPRIGVARARHPTPVLIICDGVSVQDLSRKLLPDDLGQTLGRCIGWEEPKISAIPAY
jgi:ABC-type phosphonate transport system ATPase subunit